MDRISRREFVKRATLLGAGSLLAAACGQSPAPTAAPAPAAPAGGAAAAPTVASAAKAAAPAAGGAQVNINWLSWWGKEWGMDTVNSMTEGYMKKYPNVKVETVDVGYTEVQPKLNTAGLAGQGWDVFGTEASWLQNWEKQGMVEDLTPYFEKAGPEFNNRLTDLTKVYWRGKPYAMYLYLVPFNLAYNEDKLKAMDIEPPKNWEEFFQAAQKFRQKGEYGFGYSLLSNNTQFIVKMWLHRFTQAGGQIIDPKTWQVTFNNDAGVIATEWWKRFYQANLALPGSEAENPQTTTENLATGKIAMAIDGPYIRATAMQTNPNVKIRWAPAWKAETGGYFWGGSGVALWAKGKHKQEAWNLIEHYFSDEIMLMLAKKVNQPFAVKKVFEQDWSNDPMLHALPAMQNQDPKHNQTTQPHPERGALFLHLMATVLACMKGEKTNIKQALDEEAAHWQKTIDDWKKANPA